MSLRRAASIAACMFAVAAGDAAAQWPQQQQPATAPWPQQQQQPQQPASSPWSAPQQQQQPAASPWSAQPQQQQPASAPWSAQPQQPPPCVQEFVKLREVASKRADAIRHASERKVKATAQEACGLFNAFFAAEAKMIKYAAANAASCGIPQDVVKNMKQSHGKTQEIRSRVCQAAARPPQPAGPSLSDTLTAPVPDSKNIKTGHGTFDTLTGTPLGSK